MTTPQLVELPLTGGVDQHTDARKLPLAKLLSSVNAAIFKRGKYSKRFGTTLAPTTAYLPLQTTSLAAPLTFASRGSEGLLLERGRAFTRAAAKAAWAYRDQVPEFTVREKSVAQGPGLNLDPDVAYSTSKSTIAYIWATDGAVVFGGQRIYAEIVDDASSAVIVPATALNTSENGFAPKIVCIGSIFIAMWWNGAGDIKYSTLDVAGSNPPMWSAEANLVTDINVGGSGIQFGWDAVVYNSLLYIAYQNQAANTLQLNVRSYNSSLVQQASQLGIATGGTQQFQGIAIDVGTNVWVVGGHQAGATPVVLGFVLNPSTLAVTTGATVIRTEAVDVVHNVTVLETGSTSAIVGWTLEIANAVRLQTVTNVLANTGSLRTQNRTWLQSRAFLSNGRAFALVANSTTLAFGTGDVARGTYFLVDLYAYDATGATTTTRPVATWAPRTAPEGGGRVSFSPLAAMVTDSNGKLRTVGSRVSKIVATQSGAPPPRYTVFDLAFDSDQTARQSAELGGMTYLSGGVPSWYDGIRIGECSYLQYPYATIAASTVGGNSLTLLNTYQYAIVFLHYDNAGNAHRSTPMIVSKTLTGTQNTFALTISWLNLTTRQDSESNIQKPSIEIYRTKGNDPIFRKLTPDVAPLSGVAASSAGTLQNDYTSYTVVYTDGAADATLDSQPLLYTTGGVLDNVNPPSSRLVCAHRGRIAYAGCPDGKEIWWSKLLTPGEAPGWSEGLILRVDDGGDITAIASLDDKFVVFKSDRIFFFTGIGPGDNGANSDWSDPIKLISTVGAISPFVVVTPLGIVFRSSVGLSILGRDLSVNPYWGSEIEDELVTYPTVTGMTLHPTLPEIRIQVCNAALAAGEELRYDYRADAWLPAQFGYNALANAPLRASGLLGGVAYYSTVAGSVFLEDKTLYTDNGAFVPRTLELAPVASGGTQGYQEFAELIVVGDRYTDQDMTLSMAYDEQGYTDTKVITKALQDAFTQGWQFEYSPASANKCERVRMKLVDSFGSGTLGSGRGVDLSSIGFDVKPKEGPNRRLPAVQRF